MLHKWYPDISIRCILELNLLFKLDHFLILYVPK